VKKTSKATLAVLDREIANNPTLSEDDQVRVTLGAQLIVKEIGNLTENFEAVHGSRKGIALALTCAEIALMCVKEAIAAGELEECIQEHQQERRRQDED